MNERQRRGLLFLTLAAVAGWSGWLALIEQSTEPETTFVEAATPRPATRSTSVADASGLTTNRPATAGEKRERLALARANLFPEQTWFVPPPPPPPPPPPEAPPLPYSYMGQWQEAGQTTYYLARGATPFSIRPGQVLEGTWRLDSARGGMLTFTYLPLNQTRALRTGD